MIAYLTLVQENLVEVTNRAPIRLASTSLIGRDARFYVGKIKPFDDELVTQDITLGGDCVSRRHAAIKYDGETSEIMNLSDSNGTQIQREPYDEFREVKRTVLVPGDKIRIGKNTFLYSVRKQGKNYQSRNLLTVCRNKAALSWLKERVKPLSRYNFSIADLSGTKATKGSITDGLTRYQSNSPLGLFVFYYLGNGSSEEDGNIPCTFDGSKSWQDQSSTHFTPSELCDRLAQIPGNKLVVLDGVKFNLEENYGPYIPEDTMILASAGGKKGIRPEPKHIRSILNGATNVLDIRTLESGLTSMVRGEWVVCGNPDILIE
jgi:hypothetical protein